MPLADHHGRVAFDQHGQPMTPAAHFEAWSGERQREGVFLGDRSQRRELVSPQRRQVVGDPDDDDDRGILMPYSTRAAAARIIGQNPLLRSRRQSAVGRPFTAAENAAQSRRMSHPDFRWAGLQAERERARQAQARPGVHLSNYVDETGEDLYGPVCGSLGVGISGAI
jgi:hypothetical protein